MTLSRREDPKKLWYGGTVGFPGFDVGSYPGYDMFRFNISSNVDPGLINPMVV